MLDTIQFVIVEEAVSLLGQGTSMIDIVIMTETQVMYCEQQSVECFTHIHRVPS